MSITTKSGDRGITSLYSGKRVGKADIRIEACGSIDEVSSFLGLAKDLCKEVKTKRTLNFLQKQLVILCSEISALPGREGRSKKLIYANFIEMLEREIIYLEDRRVINMRTFVIPGGNVASSALDIARAITRRAERACCVMKDKGMLKNNSILVYLNRLSDLLYLLARAEGKKGKKK